jgi:hypothetical protein
LIKENKTMNKIIKRLASLALLAGISTNLYAISQIKVICDENGENIYLNGQFKAECDSGEPVAIMAKAGRYKVEVKKNNKDGSYYYYQKKFRIGDGVQSVVEASSNIHYTEDYYYKKAKTNGNIENYWTYLKKYPHGRYVKDVKKILKNSWNRTFGGKDEDEVDSIIQTKDGNFMVAGTTSSKGAGDYDAWIIKLDKNGNKIWDKTFGGIYNAEANSIIQTRDGGYAVAGETSPESARYSDAWVIKLDKNGNKIWDKTFGGEDWDEAESIIQTRDGGYAVAGDTKSKGNGKRDAWIIKMDKNGNKIWDKTFGGKDYDLANSIIQTRDGGYAVAGQTRSKGNGAYDIWVIKFSKNLINQLDKGE